MGNHLCCSNPGHTTEDDISNGGELVLYPPSPRKYPETSQDNKEGKED